MQRPRTATKAKALHMHNFVLGLGTEGCSLEDYGLGLKG